MKMALAMIHWRRPEYSRVDLILPHWIGDCPPVAGDYREV